MHAHFSIRLIISPQDNRWNQWQVGDWGTNHSISNYGVHNHHFTIGQPIINDEPNQIIEQLNPYLS
jgi:virulence-associated protein VagC